MKCTQILYCTALYYTKLHCSLLFKGFVCFYQKPKDFNHPGLNFLLICQLLAYIMCQRKSEVSVSCGCLLHPSLLCWAGEKSLPSPFEDGETLYQQFCVSVGRGRPAGQPAPPESQTAPLIILSQQYSHPTTLCKHRKSRFCRLKIRFFSNHWQAYFSMWYTAQGSCSSLATRQLALSSW